VDASPTNSLDTFFACTILVAVALIATAFLSSTMQARIDSTQDINKDSYLKAIADCIITSSGTPNDWGTSSNLPQDFGLAQSQSTTPYEIDMDKISRLNSQNNDSLTYGEILQAAKLNNLALGITVSPLLSVSIWQSENHTMGSQTSFTFGISTSIDSKPADTSLHCYVVANNYLINQTDSTSNGVGDFTVQIPTSATDNALLVVFARASFDERITSYAVYRFGDSTQQPTPSNNVVALSVIDYTLTYTPVSPNATIEKGYLLSYSYQSNLTSPSSTGCPVPKTIDKSPFVIVVCGQNGADYFEEWTAYPQVPLTAGFNFEGSERTIFSYVVTIKDALYKVDISFGGLAS
jgi:hypothetical protein